MTHEESELAANVVPAYLDRLGFATAPPADLAGLRELHRAHLRRVPFENLDIHLGLPIELGGPAIDKIVLRHRGGICYELNGSFAALLTALGFTVSLLEGRVYGDDGALGIRYDHMCLRVELGGVQYLADVGFGAFFDAPIRLVPRVKQTDRNGVYRIEEHDDGSFTVFENDAPRYWFAPIPRTPSDFAPGAAHHQSTASHFAKGTICSIATDAGRVTVSGLKLIETVDGRRTTTQLAPGMLRELLADRFGVRLDEAAAARLSRSST